MRKRKKKKEEEELDRPKDPEHWVMKRQTLRARKEEEAKKRKRTVFVGNLPVGCTKKVRSAGRCLFLSFLTVFKTLCFDWFLFVFQSLQSLFRDKGPIESIRFRSVVKTQKQLGKHSASEQEVQNTMWQRLAGRG